MTRSLVLTPHFYADRGYSEHRSALRQLRANPRECSPYVLFDNLVLVSTHISQVFWEQQGIQTFGQRIQITRPHASQPAFERHFSALTEEYGSIQAINLLGTKENEAILTNAYAKHLQLAATQSVLGDQIGITHFDFHNSVRLGGHENVPRDLRYVLPLDVFPSPQKSIQAVEWHNRKPGQVWLHHV